jgi:hypothetical protein
MAKLIFIILLNISSIQPFSQNDSLGKLSDIELRQQDSIFRSFMFDLNSMNFDKARLSLSPKTSEMLTDVRINQLKDQFSGKDSMIMYMSGLGKSHDGTRLTILQYKYITDTNSVPLYLLKVELNDKNKIVYLQPLQRN